MTHSQSFALLGDQFSTAAPTPETIALLKSVWGDLSLDERVELLSSLGEVPSEEVRGWRDDDELRARLLRMWQWLAGIAESLPEPWAASYAILVEEFGQGDRDARRFGVHARFGSASPLEANDIDRLGPDGFVEWMEAWEPPADLWLSPTPDGLATSLREAVTRNPAPWLSAFPGLVEQLRHPIYVRGVLAGLREAMETAELRLDWSKLLPAFEQIVSEPWPVEVLSDDPFDADRDWFESQREVMRIAQSALENDANLDADQLALTWELLARIIELRRGAASSIVTDRQDLVTLAINKDSTVALRTMFLLALSASRRETVGDWGPQLAGIVGDELAYGSDEALLAGAIAASLFPQFLHVAHAEAIGLVPRLFGEPEAGSLDVALLETMVKYARPITNEVLNLFHPHMIAYFDSVPAAEGEAERSAVRWVLIGYIRHLPAQDDPQQLIELLREPSRVSEAAEFYGRVLRQEAQGTPEEREAALGFWDASLQSQLPPDAFRGFGWWSEGDAIPDEDWLPRIVPTIRRGEDGLDWNHEVVKRLCRLAPRSAAWEGLALLVRGADDRWTVAYWGGDLQQLLERTSKSSEEARALRNDLIEALLERELLDFRRYLEESPT